MMFQNEEKITLVEIQSKMDVLLNTMKSLKEKVINKVYTTEELCEYLKVGKSVIDWYRRNGELTYSKIGRTYVYTQQNVDELLERNRIKYVG